MKNNNNQNNYVTPEKVDLTKETSKASNGFLNRERENIVKATLQANESLIEEEAEYTNNVIKVKKENKIIKCVIAVIILIVIVLITYEGLVLSKRFIESGKNTTNNITTTKKINFVSKYLNNTKIARKFENNGKILILSPVINGMKNKYILIDGNTKTHGIYTLENNVVNIYNEAGEVIISLIVGNSALVTDGTSYKIMDEEFKCYASEKEILIINASIDKEVAFYTSIDGVEALTTYEETTTSIKLGNGIVFDKDNNSLLYNGNKLDFKN